jgi:flavin reductase (DIM6/NTAB) family NADH-FMN oxidoreductase RutF
MTPTTARAEFPIDTLDPLSAYRWLTASLMPRPIAWVSTIDADGVDNVAPHSFTTVASTDPAVICFVSMTTKDTLVNIRATGEFVVNLGTERLVPVMNDSATPFPAGVSEFDEAQIEREPSAVVRPPSGCRRSGGL